MKGIILAGGKGTRLYPNTIATSKQLLPIYDKPLVYYALSVLLLSDIRDVLIISTPDDIPLYEKLLSDGSQIGIRIEYKVQPQPRGLAEAFILGAEFLNRDSVCLVLGDNVFYGQFFSGILHRAKTNAEHGTANIFGYPVKNPKEFGVVEFDEKHKVLSIEEKPENPKSNYAVPGLYFYPGDVTEVAKNVQPSRRGELEITSINNYYLEKGRLEVSLMGRGMAWLDTGSAKAMHKAGDFVKTVQEMQGFYISCIEEIAWHRGYISTDQLHELGEKMKMTDYGKYIMSLTDDVR